jgi:enhancer of polycomb-like protein
VYELDPYDLKALKFRATIPLPPHLHLRGLGQNPRPNSHSPNNPRAIAPPQAAPTTTATTTTAQA